MCAGNPRPAYNDKSLREASVKTGIFLRFLEHESLDNFRRSRIEFSSIFLFFYESSVKFVGISLVEGILIPMDL